MIRIPFSALALAALAASTALAQQIVGDDFNRPDSTSLGASWVEANGDFVIQSNACRGNVQFANDTWMYNTQFAQSYVNTKVRVDFGKTAGDQLFAAGVGFGLDPNTWGGVAILVQD